MSAPHAERRRDERWDVRGDVQCRLDVRTPVRVVDISASGVLLEAHVAVPVGTHAQFRSPMATEPFAADVEVRRVAALPANPSWGIGAMFMRMSDGSRRSLGQFLKRASE